MRLWQTKGKEKAIATVSTQTPRRGVMEEKSPPRDKALGAIVVGKKHSQVENQAATTLHVTLTGGCIGNNKSNFIH